MIRIAIAALTLALLAAPVAAQDVGTSAAPAMAEPLDYNSGMMCWAQWTAGTEYLADGELRDSWTAQAANAFMFAEEAGKRDGMSQEDIDTDGALSLWLFTESLDGETLEEITANINRMAPDLQVCADRLFWSW